MNIKWHLKRPNKQSSLTAMGFKKLLAKGLNHLGIWPAPLGVPGEDGAGTALAGELLLAGSF